MGFRLKSGNRTSFKNMGGSEKSPAKDMKTGKYEHSFESPAKQNMEGKNVDPEIPVDIDEVSQAKPGSGKMEIRKKQVNQQTRDSITPAKHYVNDVPDHNDGHPDDLQSSEEHETWRKKNEKPTKSPAKQTDTTYVGGAKKSKRQIEEQKIHPSEYWYKINGKPATKAQYVAYQNKPGGDEPGKQTNDPDAMGYKAKRKADRAKLNK